MLKRILTGFVMALVAVPVCIFSSTAVFPAALAFLALVGTWEMQKCIGCVNLVFLSFPLMASAAVFPLLAFFISDQNAFLILYASSMAVMMVYILALPVFFPGKADVSDVCLSFVTSVYITTAFVSLSLLRCSENGIYYFLIPIAAPMVCDVFAYFSGCIFGKHKLIPKVSPNKTVEGAIGGVVFCTAACVIYGIILNNNGAVTGVLPAWAFAVGGVLIAVVSQTGDLIASAVKRKFGVKDYGWIFPGHGGVMDRFDSVIATAPLFLVFTVILKYIGL